MIHDYSDLAAERDALLLSLKEDRKRYEADSESLNAIQQKASAMAFKQRRMLNRISEAQHRLQTIQAFLEVEHHA
jgi:predicted nuclease with TOPRIM domain